MTTHRRTFLKKSVKLAATGLLLPQPPNLGSLPPEKRVYELKVLNRRFQLMCSDRCSMHNIQDENMGLATICGGQGRFHACGPYA